MLDAHRFDALARALSTSGTRRALSGLLVSLLGLLALPGVTPDATARKKRQRRKQKNARTEGPCGDGGGKGNRCKRNRQCCTGFCDKRKGKKGKQQKVRGRCRCRKEGQSCTGDRNCCVEQTGRSCRDGTCQTPRCADLCADGCCAGETCEAGTSQAACGANGEPCQVCDAGLQCLQGICDCGTGTVCAVGCPYATLQDAIDDPDGPATIDLCATTFAGPFTISRNLTITGAGDGEDGTILDGQGGGSTVTVDGGVTATLHGLRITGGSGNVSNDGGGIQNSGTLTLTSCTVTGNDVIDDGGGIQNSGQLTLTSCTVTANMAGDGGGIFNRGTATLVNSTVTDNVCERDGGGINNVDTGVLILTNSMVTDNTADDDGGGIHDTGEVSFLGTSCVENNQPDNCLGTATCPACTP